MTMKNNLSKNRSRLSLVFSFFAIFGLILFAALILDFGAVYATRRQAGEAAESAALAGGVVIGERLPFTNMTINNARNAGAARAATNGFDRAGSDNSVAVSISGPYNNGGFDYYIARAEIAAKVDTVIVHHFFSGVQKVNVVAEAAIIASQSLIPVTGSPLYDFNLLDGISIRDGGLVVVTSGDSMSPSWVANLFEEAAK